MHLRAGPKQHRQPLGTVTQAPAPQRLRFSLHPLIAPEESRSLHRPGIFYVSIVDTAPDKFPLPGLNAVSQAEMGTVGDRFQALLRHQKIAEIRCSRSLHGRGRVMQHIQLFLIVPDYEQRGQLHPRQVCPQTHQIGKEIVMDHLPVLIRHSKAMIVAFAQDCQIGGHILHHQRRGIRFGHHPVIYPVAEQRFHRVPGPGAVHHHQQALLPQAPDHLVQKGAPASAVKGCPFPSPMLPDPGSSVLHVLRQTDSRLFQQIVGKVTVP